jgi:hypothetical protein
MMSRADKARISLIKQIIRSSTDSMAEELRLSVKLAFRVTREFHMRRVLDTVAIIYTHAPAHLSENHFGKESA